MGICFFVRSHTQSARHYSHHAGTAVLSTSVHTVCCSCSAAVRKNTRREYVHVRHVQRATCTPTPRCKPIAYVFHCGFRFLFSNTRCSVIVVFVGYSSCFDIKSYSSSSAGCRPFKTPLDDRKRKRVIRVPGFTRVLVEPVGFCLKARVARDGSCSFGLFQTAVTQLLGLHAHP